MFGLGFGEMVVLGVVLIVVVGPRELPKLLRSIGSGIRKLRQMSTDLRDQSGIDDIINEEGLREDLDTIRSLSRGRVVDGLVNPTRPKPARRPRVIAKKLEQLTVPQGDRPDRETEYPVVGPDSYGALADDATEEEVAAALKAIEEKEVEAVKAEAARAEAARVEAAKVEAAQAQAAQAQAEKTEAQKLDAGAAMSAEAETSTSSLETTKELEEPALETSETLAVDDEPLFDLSPPEGTVEANSRPVAEDTKRAPAEESAT